MRFVRHIVTVLTAFLLATAPFPVLLCQGTQPVGSASPRYKVLILGNQDSLGRAFTKAVNDRVQADVRGTVVRLATQRDLDMTMLQEAPPEPLTDDDMKEIATLVNADVLYIATVQQKGETLLVRTGVRFPRRSPVRTLAGTISATSTKALIDSVASAIMTDTTYRRMRGSRPK